MLHEILVLTIGLSTVAQSTAQPPRPQQSKPKPSSTQRPPAQNPDGMTNAEVVQLVKAGFGEDLIVGRIRQSPIKSFDVSTAALVNLKTAGVSERIIATMLGLPETSQAPQTGGSSPYPTKTPAQPATQAISLAPPATKSVEGRDAGIYIESSQRVVQLEPTVFTGAKTGGVFTSSLTMGIKKVKWKAVVRSPGAVQRVQTTTPEFYFYFETTSSGLSNTGGLSTMLGASSPNEFVLARMTKKSNERELIVGEFGAFGASSGTRSQDTIELLIEKLGAGTYRVVPKYPLGPGEYCFFYAAGASSFAASGTGKLFDFGVDPAGEG